MSKTSRFLVICISIAALVIFSRLAYDKPVPPVTLISQQAAQTQQGVQQAATKTPLSSHQATVIASAVERSATKPPDQIIRTTGSDWEAMTEKLRKQSGADFTMVTEPKRPNQKPAPQPEEPVNLNVYNIKAYPKEFQQIGIAQDAVMASANWRVGKTKTKSWYVGVWGIAELKQPERSKIGVVLTRM